MKWFAISLVLSLFSIKNSRSSTDSEWGDAVRQIHKMPESNPLITNLPKRKKKRVNKELSNVVDLNFEIEVDSESKSTKSLKVKK